MAKKAAAMKALVPVIDPVVLAELPKGPVIDARLAQLAADLAPLVERASTYQVTDSMSHRTAVEMMVAMKAFLNDAEKSRKEWKEPVLDAGRIIDASVKQATGPAEASYKVLNARATAWQVTEEDRRERELAEQREREQAAQRAANDAAEKKGLPAPFIPPAEAPPVVETHVQTRAGSGTLVRRWTYELLDASALMGCITEDLVKFAADPKNNRAAIVLALRNRLGAAHPELFELSGARAKALVDAGARNVPGLRIYQVATTATKA